jgi:hypothetical protein
MRLAKNMHDKHVKKLKLAHTSFGSMPPSSMSDSLSSCTKEYLLHLFDQESNNWSHKLKKHLPIYYKCSSLQLKFWFWCTVLKISLLAWTSSHSQKKGNQGAPNSSTATLSVFQKTNPWIQYQNVGSTWCTQIDCLEVSCFFSHWV